MSDGRGISQAEMMRRRVSPEGRRLAALEQARRRRTTYWIGTQGLLLVAAAGAAAALWEDPAGSPRWIEHLVLLVLTLLGGAGLFYAARRDRATAAPTVTASLPALPSATMSWLADQRAVLPAPALTLVDVIASRVEALAPHLAHLDPATPAADDVRKLLGRELPTLVDQYHAVPATLRGGEADARLLHGLGLVNRQLDALTREIASGAVDGLATQDRYLESKYSGGV